MKLFGKFLVASALATAATTTAQAQVYIEGTATGCFGVGCLPGSVDNSIPSLVFRGSTFSGFTAGGGISFGGNPAPTAGAFNIDNFGSFVLSDAAVDYAALNSPFTLHLAFTNPALGAVDFVGTLSGTVVDQFTGGASINFDNNYVSIPGGAAFSLQARVNDVDINPHQNASVDGRVLAATATVPEPASIALMATGLIALAGVARRRRA